MAIFELDGLRHEVVDDDQCVIHGPGWLESNLGVIGYLERGKKFYIMFKSLPPGEDFVVSYTFLPPTIFYKPKQKPQEVERKVEEFV